MRLKLNSIWALAVAFEGLVPAPGGFEGARRGVAVQALAVSAARALPAPPPRPRIGTRTCTHTHTHAHAHTHHVPPPTPGAFITGSPVLSWAANNTAKLNLDHGGRPLQCWTLLSTAEWGRCAAPAAAAAVPPPHTHPRAAGVPRCHARLLPRARAPGRRVRQTRPRARVPRALAPAHRPRPPAHPPAPPPQRQQGAAGGGAPREGRGRAGGDARGVCLRARRGRGRAAARRRLEVRGAGGGGGGGWCGCEGPGLTARLRLRCRCTGPGRLATAPRARAARTGVNPAPPPCRPPAAARAQLWGAALPLNGPGAPCILDPVARVGVCGDWLADGGVEGGTGGGASLQAAALSGLALAERLARLARVGAAPRPGVKFATTRARWASAWARTSRRWACTASAASPARSPRARLPRQRRRRQGRGRGLAAAGGARARGAGR